MQRPRHIGIGGTKCRQHVKHQLMKLRSILLLAAAQLFLAPLGLSAQKVPAGITVMSFNIRMGTANDGTNSWEYRYPATAMMIYDQKPDVVGVQEALYEQVMYLKNALSPDYKVFGVGREDGRNKGEHMEILYNKKTVKVLKWGTFWLSETPKKPSMGWDAACYRSATWALMKEKKSGRKFYMVNTHLDHIGVVAREKGLQLICNKIAEMNKSGLPMVLTGDFNMEITDPSMAPVKKAMKNARTDAVKTDDHFSYNGWGKDSDTIDYVWYSGFSSCTEFQTVTKPYMDRTFISDHFPVKAHLIF
jgi:endonuclease/exonuclease/phosphatase family metal-dependent hydrolase